MSAQHRYSGRVVRRWLARGLLAVLIGVFGLGVSAVASGRYQMRPVLSGSMRPGLPVGGIVITKRVPITSLHVRDVVVLHRPDRPQELVVHRIVSLTPGASGPTVRTQGDANDVADPWQATLRGSTAYRAVYSLPLVGYVAVWVHSPAGRESLLAVGFLLVMGAAASSVFTRRREAKDHLEPAAIPATVAAVQPLAAVVIPSAWSATHSTSGSNNSASCPPESVRR